MSKQQIEQHIRSQAEVMAEWRTFAPEIRAKVAEIEAQRAAAKERQEAAETRLTAAEQRIQRLMQRITALELAEAAQPLNQIKNFFKRKETTT